MHISRRIH